MISANLVTSLQQEVNKLNRAWSCEVRGNKKLTDEDVRRLLRDIYLVRKIMTEIVEGK